MSSAELAYFQKLKLEVAITYKKVYPSCDIPIEEWTSQDITNFQEELLQHVKGQLSEKWFYTHIKGRQDKIPRLDMLNMLSEYAGFKNWRDFTSQFVAPQAESVQTTVVPVPEKANSWTKWIWVLIPTAIAIYAASIFIPSERTYYFCFIDADLKHPITVAPVEVSILKAGQSPILMECDTDGCFKITTSEKSIRFAVSSAYHKPDTITRHFSNRVPPETIKLKTDDYALMIHMFSNSNIDDWKKRRAQLDDMIADDARIFQVNPGTQNGMELYNKQGFINKLTTPIRSLKNIEVLEVQYSDSQISSMRFIQTEEAK